MILFPVFLGSLAMSSTLLIHPTHCQASAVVGKDASTSTALTAKAIADDSSSEINSAPSRDTDRDFSELRQYVELVMRGEFTGALDYDRIRELKKYSYLDTVELLYSAVSRELRREEMQSQGNFNLAKVYLEILA